MTIIIETTPDETYWRKVRSEFTLEPGYTFLNHGTLGPTPHAVTDVIHRSVDDLSRDPGSDFLALKTQIDAVRSKLARFVNADIDEVSLTRSTTEGMNIFAHGLDWKPDDEVILNTHEHFAAVQPYQTLRDRYGIKIVTIDVPAVPDSAEQIIAAYRNALTPRTRVIVVSHVSYVTGLLAPIQALADLAHRHGVLISVDGAQSVGVLPLDLRASDVDHFAGSGQKWLLAGSGTGITYIKRAVQPKVWPLQGYHNPNADRDGPYAGQRYERVGQKNIPSLLAIGAALDFHTAIGTETIALRIRELAARLRSGLKVIPGVTLSTANDPELTAGLTTFSIANLAPADTVKALKERYQIIVRPIIHAEVSAVRASTHVLNTRDDVDHLVEAVCSLALTS
jgi:selenocysteine lyase/cysteine desulfurase